MNQNIAIQIQENLDENKLSDLKKFINKRQCLNTCNFYMSYLFHFVQSAGILTTTIATGYNMKELIWTGIGLNIAASLLRVYEQTNNNISSKILEDINAIKNNTYIDEGLLIDMEEIKQKNTNN